jgi:putative flippase GtrA
VDNGLISMVKDLLVKYKSFIRYAIVGVINTLVTIGVNTACNNLIGLSLQVSWVIGTAAGITNSYIMNTLWTFESKGGSKQKNAIQMIKFVIVNLISLGATTLALTYLVENRGIDKNIAQFPMILISQLINYTGYKFWVYKK